MEKLVKIVKEITPHEFMGDTDYITATQLTEQNADLAKILGVDNFKKLKESAYLTAKAMEPQLKEKGININNEEDAWIFFKDMVKENIILSLWGKLMPYAADGPFIVNMATSFSIHNKFKTLKNHPLSSDDFFQHIDVELNLEIANSYKKHLTINQQTYYDCLSDKQKIVYFFNEAHNLLFKGYLIKSIMGYAKKHVEM